MSTRRPTLSSRAALRVYGPILATFAIIALAWLLRDDLDRALNDDGELFFGEIDSDLLDDYRNVLGVAHNAGNLAGPAQLAIEHNADVIEIDVVASAESLYAGHEPPPRLVAPPSQSAIPLALAWEASREADYVMLDLKQSSRSFLIRLAAFLHTRPSDNTYIVSRSSSALRFFAEETPRATLLMSIASKGALDRLLAGDDLPSTVHGVSVFAGLLDEETMTELKARDLTVFAWVVNTLPQVNELVAIGVDGIISDNLAILQLLGGPGGAAALAVDAQEAR